MSDLDRIFQELAEIRRRLEDLAPDASEERTRLESQREQLHAEATALEGGFGDERPTPVILVELESLRERLSQIENAEIDIVKQHGGSALEASRASVSMDLNRQIEAGQGADEIRDRIRELEGVLEKRGEPPS